MKPHLPFNANNHIKCITYELDTGERFIIDGADIENFIFNMFSASNVYIGEGGKLKPVNWKQEKSLAQMLGEGSHNG